VTGPLQHFAAVSTDPSQEEEPLGDAWVGARSRETRALLRLRKRNLLLAMREDPTSADASVGELAAIDRLELRLANRARILRIRERTRGPQ
jgi:hypothetical protein